MEFKKNFPNMLTCANLLCGCIGIKLACDGFLVLTACFIGAALVFDFFDGFAARMLKAGSPFGKDLDSLADMVTFGVLPGIIMFQLMKVAVQHEGTFFEMPYSNLLPFTAFIIPVFSALRLAKFNNDTRQSNSFIGLPTPANTMLIASLPLILTHATLDQPFGASSEAAMQLVDQKSLIDVLLNNYWVLLAITVTMSWLLVAELPMFALKFRKFGWNDNKLSYSFIACCLLLIIIFKFAAVPLIILVYIGLSVINNLQHKLNKQ